MGTNPIERQPVYLGPESTPYTYDVSLTSDGRPLSLYSKKRSWERAHSSYWQAIEILRFYRLSGTVQMRLAPEMILATIPGQLRPQRHTRKRIES